MSRESPRQDGSILNGNANENLPVLSRVVVRIKWSSHCWSVVKALFVGNGSSMAQNCWIKWSIEGSGVNNKETGGVRESAED
ncbi:unnamed protein product [Macrosiphum euphorbiae]|uniref:Uncharacterized protein n=1 Tax=Macrosiphum euphorbiae TaxID=13131 RepID=A0AAV0Y6J4_9HEMI|nr:unnamed protein product [Macrosiphum euphorbiae]